MDLTLTTSGYNVILLLVKCIRLASHESSL